MRHVYVFRVPRRVKKIMLESSCYGAVLFCRPECPVTFSNRQRCRLLACLRLCSNARSLTLGIDLSARAMLSLITGNV